MNWRQQSVAILAAKPTKWLRLAELFAEVETTIPIHIAMRCANRDQEEEVGLNTARWRLFLRHIRPLVERAADDDTLTYRARRTDLVRLRPEAMPCSACGGPRFLSAWPEHGGLRQYACVNCQKPKAVVVETPAPAPTPEIVAPLPAPIVMHITKPPPPTPKPKLVIVPKPQPPPRRHPRTFMELALLSSIKEIWNAFEWEAEGKQPGFPRFYHKQEHRKLRWVLHRALEAGAANEHLRLSRFPEQEYRQLGDPTFSTLNAVLYWRAREWVEEETPGLTQTERDDWAGMLREAHHFGALTVVSITDQNRLTPMIRYELDRLVSKHKLERRPPQRQRAPPQQRWLSPIKNVSRWRRR